MRGAASGRTAFPVFGVRDEKPRLKPWGAAAYMPATFRIFE
jgi:hypothetical protein